MLWTTTTRFRTICRIMLCLFVFQSVHPATWRVPWMLDISFATWPLDFGPTPAYGQSSDPNLAATPDANKDDTFIIQKAQELGNDPVQIFNFVRDEIGYESYKGSLRGARGTLWSKAGNALDQASLLIALLRASNIPARYVQGTLPDNLAQQLILSMFPAPLLTVGCLDPGTEVADPANDPKLLTETREHFWVQFDRGGGFQDADPTFTSAQIGQTFTSSQGIFTEVPDGLRHKVTVRLNRELTIPGAGLLTGGFSQNMAIVLDRTFPSAALAGKSVSIGHGVQATELGALFATTTHIYTPYLVINERDGNILDDLLFGGEDYQEMLTSFPLGSQILTGLFLKVTILYPEIGGTRQTESFEKTLLDRIGFTARQGGGAGDPMSVSPDEPPALHGDDIISLDFSTSALPVEVLEMQRNALAQIASDLEIMLPVLEDPVSAPPSTVQEALRLVEIYALQNTSLLVGDFLTQSHGVAEPLRNVLLTRAYFDSPRIVSARSTLGVNAATQEGELHREIDIMRNVGRAVPRPGQAELAETTFPYVRGLFDSLTEQEVLSTGVAVAGSANIFQQASLRPGVTVRAFLQQNISQLSSLPISDEAKARITQSVLVGKVVLVPDAMITIGGVDRVAWIEVDPTSGDFITVSDDGTHGVNDQPNPILVKLIANLRKGVEVAKQKAEPTIEDLGNAWRNKDLTRARELGKRFLEDVGPTMLASTTGFVAQGIGAVKEIELLKQINAVGGDLTKVSVKKEPPVGHLLFGGTQVSPEFATLGSGGESGLAAAVTLDPLFTVPVGGALVPTVFKVGFKNLTSVTDIFTINVASVPGGFSPDQSVPSIQLPPGETGEISVCLRPTTGVPAAGMAVSFDVAVTSTNNPGISATVHESFAMPAIPGVTFSLDPPAVSSTPGVPVETTLMLTSVGNMPADVTFAINIAPDVTLTGLTPVTLNPGETITQTLRLTPASSMLLNSTRSIFITPQFGQPEPVPFAIVLHIGAPGAAAIARATIAAEQLGNADLAQRLGDLSIVLTELFESPGSDVFKSQALAALDSIISQLTNDRNFSSFGNDLTAERHALAAANTANAIQTAVNSLGNTLDAFAASASGLAQHNFEAFLLPNSQTAQPQTPAVFELRLHNIGTDTTTYNISLGALPSGVTGQLSQASVTLDRDEFATVNVTLTQTATTELLAFNFAVTVAAAEAPSVSRTVQGALTVRNDFISVVEVSADPPFTDPGAQVNVSARLLNGVNQQRQALVSYIVKNPNGQTVFTSQPVQTTLTVQTSLDTLTLGALDTTGFDPGQHSIVVTVTDLNSTPIPGATGEGNLLIGSPVTASIAIAPTTLPPGNGMVLNTLQINSQGGAGGQLAVVGQVPSTAFVGNAVLNDLALNGNFAYVFANNGLHVVDIANPTAPAWLRNVGGGEHSSGEVAGDRLIAIEEGPSSSFARVSARGLIDFFTLAGPGTPAQPFRQQSNTFTYQAASDLIVVGNNAFVATNLVCFNTTTNDVFSQHGDVLSISIDPSRQITSNIFQLEDVLLNTNGSTQDGVKTPGCWENGGNFNLVDIVQVSADTLLAASSTATGTNTQTGFGRIRVVDISNPASLAVIDAEELQISGTVQVHGIAINGNVAFVTATQGGWRDPFTDVNDIGPTGNIVLATVDVTTPRNPQLLHTQVLNRAARGMGEPLFVGNGRFAFASLGSLTDSPQIIVVDASNPNDLVIVTQFDVAAPIRGMRTAGNFLYTSGPDGLTIYQLGGLGNIPVTAQVQIPNNTGVAVVPNSFSIPPTSSISGMDFDTLVWEFTGSQTVTWQSNMTNLQPGEAREVTLGTTVDFTFQGTPGQITLPPTFVTSQHILAMAPPTRTVLPGEAASYTLAVKNPTAGAVTYALSVQGIPLAWVDLAPSITVPANSETNVALTLTSDPFAALAEYGFVVTASTNTGTTGSVQGSLLLQGAPVLPSADPVARGVVVSLTPAQATAGQGTPAHFVLRLTNTGSATDTFSLTAGVPTGVTATLEVTSVEVPPGASNFRDVSLTLTPQPGSATGNRSFTVTATSAIQATVHDTANGTVTVVGNGVDVALTPTSGPPSSTYQLRVTNTGQGQDTFDLAAGGPGGLVATLGTNAVTLASGASQNVPITVGAINFAYTGNLALVGIATSRGNQAVQDSATATVTIAATQSITARFDPAIVTLPIPGAAAFLLLVDNTGNTEDAYTAAITGTIGPITPSLNGLDGQPTQTIPLFRLPGLSRGALVLDTTLTAAGQGMVTVRITSQTNAAITASATATVQTPGGGNHAPVAHAGPDQTLPLGETVLLDGSASTDPDNGPADLSFQWSVAARPTGSAPTNAQISDATTARAAFTPDVIGDYTLRLTVSDGALFAADEVLIHVQNTPPVAEAGPDRTAKTGMEVTLNGSDSFDPNGDLITYDWTLVEQPAGSALTSQSLTGRQTPNPIFTPGRRGRYVFELIVNDGLVDSEPDTVAITASPSNVPPNADAGPDQHALVGTAVVLDGSTSHDPDQSPRPLTYQWTFKQVPAGSTLRNAHIQTAMQVQASFVPDMAGTYALNLRVSDGSASGNDEVVITASASNVPPNADASEDQTVTPGAEVALEGLGSHDPDNGPAALSYTWRFVSLPHGSIRTNADIVDADLATARFTPDVVGSYVVRLEVFDGEASAFDNVLITATPCIERVTASPNVLWPPNHKMVPVTVGVSVSNRCPAAPVCQISSVRSNEPVNGLGDGDTAPDWEFTGPTLTVRLRAERSGQGSGRVYTITVSCTEGAGHNETGTTTVQVPHDQGKKK